MPADRFQQRPQASPTSTGEPAVTPVVSVVLCARNAARTLPRQLGALRAQDFAGPWELLLVDNASSDATHDLMTKCAETMPGCRALVEPRAGVNGARNRAIEASRASKIALCDADDEVTPAWLRQMVDALDHFDVVGGALKLERLNAASVRPRHHNQTHALPVWLGRPYAVGANIGFRKAVWATTGGFDAQFSGGCDETDFCLRAQDAGYTIGFAADAIVHYRLRAELELLAKQHFGYGRGEERLLAKRTGLGLTDGGLRTRWRFFATEGGRHLAASPAMLVQRTERRRWLERSAFLTGRGLELLRLSSANRGRGPRDQAVTPSS
jgi:glycosyltransferase involved in cell wall biosynthesis